MRKPFYFILSFLLTLFAFQCLPLTGPGQTVFAEENTATQEVKSPSFTVKGANITPVKQESGKKQSDKSTTGDQPHLSIDPSSHNVGEIWEGDDIIHSFIVKNTGKAQLDIKNVKAG
jgi:hypothetical protein